MSSAIAILDHFPIRGRLLAPLARLAPITLTTNSFSRGGRQQHVLSSQPRSEDGERFFFGQQSFFLDFSCVVVEVKQACSLQFLASLPFVACCDPSLMLSPSVARFGRN